MSSSSPPRSNTPTCSDPLAGRHVIYRGLTKSSMEYTSLAHSSKQPEAAHTLKGEILISGRHHPGYIQYCITLDQDWMTRRVLLTALFDGGQEKRLILEVDQDQRWYKVTEHRLARSRSFFRSGIDSPARSSTTNASTGSSALNRSNSMADDSASSSRTSSESTSSSNGMQDADTCFSDGVSCCSASSFSSSSSDLERSIPFEKINLTWTPPAKGSKRGSKRFSAINPLKDVLVTPTSMSVSQSAPQNTLCAIASCTTTTAETCMFPSIPPTIPSASTSATESSSTPAQSATEATFPTQSMPQRTALRSPVVGFTTRTLSKRSSTTSFAGPKTYEHLPLLDGCIHLDLGRDISPSTLLLPLRRATLGIDPDDMDSHLATLISCPSAITSELTAVVSFPDLELSPLCTHVAYIGQGNRPGLNLVEHWTDEDEDEVSTIVEVDMDGLVVQYGDSYTRIPTF
ncbi:hypothetical protein BG011_001050 [Mortierella polycephala]|uniref:Uncharacterized protein n=1 Tax=Mortierella polycephala TaxID=41804 RepID=A0A9P6TVH1_9FUNG|nr:hypothetical protein BG011_001050 [Mortierella polycephala]